MKIQLYQIFVIFKYGKYLHTSCLIRIYIDLFSSNCVQSVDGYKKNIRKLNLWIVQTIYGIRRKCYQRFPRRSLLDSDHLQTRQCYFAPIGRLTVGPSSQRSQSRLDVSMQGILMIEWNIWIKAFWNGWMNTYPGRQVGNWNWPKRHLPPERSRGRTRTSYRILRSNHRRVSKPWPVSNSSLSWIPPVFVHFLNLILNSTIYILFRREI